VLVETRGCRPLYFRRNPLRINPPTGIRLFHPNTGHWGEFGWSGILRGASLVFFAYIGFDAVSTAAPGSQEPAAGHAIGIIGSLIICTVLYILVSGSSENLVVSPEQKIALRQLLQHRGVRDRWPFVRASFWSVPAGEQRRGGPPAAHHRFHRGHVAESFYHRGDGWFG